MKTNKLLLSLSGGKSSAMMTIHCLKSPIYANYDKVVVFANTGLEHEKTIEFLQKIEDFTKVKIHLLEGVYPSEYGVGVRHKEVNFGDLKMDGSPMRNAILKKNLGAGYGLPNTATPYCSPMTKERVINSFAKQYFGTTKYLTAIGFRTEDMPKRVVPIQVKKIFDKKIYPLLSDFSPIVGIKERDEFWSKMPFNLEINSRYGNCQLCYKKSDLTLFETLKNNPSLVDWYDKMEKETGGTFFRGKRTVLEMLEQAQAKNVEYKFLDSEECFCS